jgi:hypothetical protein
MAAKAVLRRAAIGTVLALGAGLIAWSFLSVYSPPSSEPDFLTPTRRLLRAGLALDSVALAGMDVAPSALQWALSTGRENPALLRALDSGLRAEGGMRNGDRSAVWFRANGFKRCNGWPLRVRFSGRPATTRIEEVIVDCDEPLPPLTRPAVDTPPPAR